MVSVKFWCLYVKNKLAIWASLRRRVVVLGLAALSAAPPVLADNVADLQALLRASPTGQLSFKQTVTAPIKAGQTRAKQTRSTGQFLFARPGKFRFDYETPFPQSIIADGQSLWLWDPDLNQVTVRNQAQALGNTPAALIAGSGDLNALNAAYVVRSMPSEAGLKWVEATPKQVDGTLRVIRVGFDAQQLRAMVMIDNFGQTSDMRFDALQSLEKGAVTAAFRFVPPSGADVIRP